MGRKLEAAFELAAGYYKKHHNDSRIPTNIAFRLYGLFKRSKFGACNTRQPLQVLEAVARERWTAWRSVSDLTQIQAMREYVDTVSSYLPEFAARHEAALKELESDVETIKEENATLLQSMNELIKNLNDYQRSELDKRGNLYKWRPETVGFGGTKWQRRYIVLEGSVLNVYTSSSAAAPSKVIRLKNCVVNKEPPRHDGKYFVFSLGPADPAAPDAPELEEEGGVVIRLSTRSSTDCDEWVEALQKGCLLASARVEPVSPDVQLVEAVPSTRLRRQVSKGLLQKAQLEQALNERPVEKVKSEAHKVDPKLYPPSYAYHLKPRPSVLSSDHDVAADFRGLLNLAMIVVGVYFARSIVDILRVLLHNAFEIPTLATQGLHELLRTGLSLIGFIQAALLIEWLAYRRYLPDGVAMLTHTLNTAASLIVPTHAAWRHPEAPLGSFALLFMTTVTFLKLWSYAHANWDYRTTWFAKTKGGNGFDDNAKPLANAAAGEKTYPETLTLGHTWFFFLSPTLCYQMNYPRTPHIRWRHVFTLVFRIVYMSAFAAFIVKHQMQPIVEGAVADLDSANHLNIISALLKLAIPSTAVWLIFFYVYFHLTLNLLAELLRFGDRLFYKDWWNSTSFSRYWRTWNMPVHQWVARHVYFPLQRLGLSNKHASIAVFVISAVFHELLVSVPCHVVRMWAFVAMVGQVPLVFLTDYVEKLLPKDQNDNAQIGNFAFWVIFCILGQPMAVLLYYYDFQRRHIGA